MPIFCTAAQPIDKQNSYWQILTSVIHANLHWLIDRWKEYRQPNYHISTPTSSFLLFSQLTLNGPFYLPTNCIIPSVQKWMNWLKEMNCICNHNRSRDVRRLNFLFLLLFEQVLLHFRNPIMASINNIMSLYENRAYLCSNLSSTVFA